MDQRDFQILLELTRQPFASAQALGRSIGVTGNAVKARIHRMELDHLLNGFYVMPSASVFRRYWQVLPFGPVDPEPHLGEVLAVEDVVNVWRGRPRTLMVNLYTLSPDAAPPTRLMELLRCVPAEVVLPEPPDRRSFSESTLSSLEWRVIDALIDRPRASLAQVAESTGLSPRTVRLRRDSLVARGLLTVLPNFDTTGEPASWSIRGTWWRGVARTWTGFMFPGWWSSTGSTSRPPHGPSDTQPRTPTSKKWRLRCDRRREW